MRARVVAALLLGAALLAGCASTRVIPAPGVSRPAPRTSTPKPGQFAVVAKGDTLYGIAFRNGIDTRDLAAWNGIAAPYTIYPGQRLRLYPGGGRRTASATPPRTAATKPPVLKPAVPVVAPTRPISTPAGPVGSATKPAPPAAPATSPFAWGWPAEGELIGRYVAGEATRQGIDIAGANGSPVRAAGDGVVVYSGSGLVGYGELIIVKHDDAWLSAYGHNRARLVNEGQLVKAGQQIAEMGRSGAARDMLHFEIRHNGKPVDPLRYLPKR